LREDSPRKDRGRDHALIDIAEDRLAASKKTGKAIPVIIVISRMRLLPCRPVLVV
jgi:hypothetical protein